MISFVCIFCFVSSWASIHANTDAACASDSEACDAAVEKTDALLSLRMQRDAQSSTDENPDDQEAREAAEKAAEQFIREQIQEQDSEDEVDDSSKNTISAAQMNDTRRKNCANDNSATAWLVQYGSCAAFTRWGWCTNRWSMYILRRCPRSCGTCHPVAGCSEIDENKDVLTVMNSNTYLIGTKKDLVDRREGYVEWLTSLSCEEMPDVIAFQEIMSYDSDQLMKALCTHKWKLQFLGFNDLHGLHARVFTCTDESPWGFATSAINEGTRFMTAGVVTGGVVVMVKKGITIDEYNDDPFEAGVCSGSDCSANKGIGVVKINKRDQAYWIVATHTDADGCQDGVVNRAAQFKHMRSFIERKTGTDTRVVFVGDMNIFTGGPNDPPFPCNDDMEITGWSYSNETDTMLENLGGSAPAWAGNRVDLGFWLPLDGEITSSNDINYNPYSAYVYEAYRLGDQQFDWVIAPGPDDGRYQKPEEFKWQFFPIKQDECFESELGIEVDDLTDHNGIYAQLCYDKPCPDVPKVRNHRGRHKILPHGPNCGINLSASCNTGSECPGRISSEDVASLVKNGHNHALNIDFKGKIVDERKDFSGRCSGGTGGTPCSKGWGGKYCGAGEICECVWDGNECRSDHRR